MTRQAVDKDDLKGLTKDKLIELVLKQDAYVAKLEHKLSAIEAKHRGIVGHGATKNPYVK